MNFQYKKYWRTYLRIRNQCNEVIEIQSDRDKMIWGLYARVDALATENMILLNSGLGAGSAMLIRGMLESQVEMQCLINDADHVQDIRARDISQERKHLSRYKKDNVFYNYSSQEEVDDKIEKLGKELNGRTPLNIHDRFKKVDELELYYTVYHTLSEGSHPSLSTISQAHDGNNYSLVGRPHAKISNFDYLSTINAACISLIFLLEYQEKGKGHIIELKRNIERATERGREIARMLS